jgi:hypothetical protein
MKFVYSPNISTLDAYEQTCASVRGVFIHYFTRIEVMIDTIIRKNTFDDENLYKRYMDILSPGDNTSMKTKLKLFELCVEKYQNNNGGDYSKMLDKLKTLVDIRHKLAHWMLDTSSEGVELFRKEITLSFINSKRDCKPISFKEDMLDKAKITIQEIQDIIVKIHTDTGSGLL